MIRWWTRRKLHGLARIAVGATLFQAAGTGGCTEEQLQTLAADFTAGIVQAVANQFVSDAINELFNAAGGMSF